MASVAKKEEIMVSPVQMNILLRVNRYDCLTNEQVQDIFHWKSYRHAAERMQILSELGLLERKKLPNEDLGGATWLYKIGEQGRTALRRNDPLIDIPRFNMGADKLVISTQWWHTVYATDVLIRAHLWQEETEGFRIARMETERALQRRSASFPKAPFAKSTTEKVIPDGFLEIHDLIKKDKYCFCLEVETGSHEMADIRDKVRNLVSFYDNGYERAFGVDFVVFLFIAMGIKKRSIPAEKHRTMMLTTIAETLREIRREDMANSFYVTSGKPRDMALFTQPIWYTPVVTNESYEPHLLFA